MDRSLNFQEKYDAYCRNDARYEGIFFTAVKTTGVFCRPGCKARAPKPENVLFFDTAQEAIQNGFRPCKRCKPMEHMDAAPEYIRNIIAELQDNPFLRVKDYDLRKRNIEPSHIRRWFKKNHNMTFHAYQRMLRINIAFSQIKNGETITMSAFDSGYDSLSGFNEGYRSIFGDSVSRTSNKSIINIVRFTTPLGPMFACATEHGICLLEFTDRRMLETEFKDLCHKLNAVILPGSNPHLERVQKEIDEYFTGERQSFTVPLDSPGTDFQKRVWKALQKIPYGKTRSYQQQAIAIDNPNAVRAVGSANGQNRISILIPCHRVIASDGKLAGYGGGLHRKKWLLDFESRNV